MKIHDLLDVELLHHHLAEGTVRAQSHPTEPLTIYNYTKGCQWSGAWDAVTTQTRGLIVDEDDNVLARPFPKFFNLAEHQGENPGVGKLTMTPPVAVYEKLDGSLGIAYLRPSDGKIQWATRGSFDSQQARWANEFWARREAEGALEDDQFPDLTIVSVLAEIVYPANRIVVDYADTEQLVLLGVLDLATGQQLFPAVAGLDAHDAEATWPGGTIAAHIGYLDSMDVSALPTDVPNAEGFVLLSADRKTRVKVKLAEYVRLHRLLTGVNERTIWEHLRAGGDVDTMRQSVPEEFLTWVDKVEARLLAEHAAVIAAVDAEFDRVNLLVDHDSIVEHVLDQPATDIVQSADTIAAREYRKQFAIAGADSPHRPALFMRLDGNDQKLGLYAWAQIRPAVATAFAVDPDEAEEA